MHHSSTPRRRDKTVTLLSQTTTSTTTTPPTNVVPGRFLKNTRFRPPPTTNNTRHFSMPSHVVMAGRQAREETMNWHSNVSFKGEKVFYWNLKHTIPSYSNIMYMISRKT